MNTDERLVYERHVRDRRAIVAVVAGVLLVAASVVQLGGPHTKVDELTLDLLVANRRFPLDLIAAVLNGLATLGIAGTLLYLLNCAQARNPGVKSWIRYIVIAGCVLSAVAGVVYAVIVATKVHEFATTGAQTYQEADHLTSGAGLLLLQLVGQLAALLVAVAFVMVSLQAMNQGLLTRFLGYLGMFSGALVLFQITQVPVVQCFWLFAVAYLVSGRWPTGLPPSWLSGRPEPWPSGAEARAARAAAGRGGGGGGGGGRGARVRPTRTGAPATQAAGANGSAGDAEIPGRTRSATPKRKRKHRR